MAPWLQSGWSPISPEALTLELGHGEVRHTQTVPVLGSVRAPLALGPGRLVLVPGESHEILLRNDTQETVRIAEIRMPAGFLVSEWVAGSAQIGPGSHSILRVKWDAGIGPRRIGLEGSWAPAVGLEGFDGRSEPTIIGVLPTGGVLIPPGPHGGPEVKLYPDFPES